RNIVSMKFLLVVLFAAAASAGFAPLHTQKNKIAGSYIVNLKNTINVKDAVATIKGLPFFTTLGGKIDREYSIVMNGFAATLSKKALEIVRRFDFVDFVEEDQMMYATATFASWGLDRVDQRDLPLSGSYNPKDAGSGVSVYVIDTGINPTHREFGNRAIAAADFYDSGDGIDCNGHGTHCAGTIGGDSYGVAKSVNLYGVRVLGCLGSGSNAGVVDGMDYVAAQSGKRIASMSLGGGVSLSTDLAVGRLYDAGVPVIVAAGNENSDACGSSPAGASKAYTIGATDDTDRIASFSNWGTCVDLFAPGVDIVSATHSNTFGSATMSGTSMACPHVAGAAALECGVLSCSPSTVYAALTANGSSGRISGLLRSAPNTLLYVG
ncbi:S8 family peptidase, partial [Salmonella sp. S146_54837]|uniref:S8 family peptidase n=1 Tax=Salmonella sp. S146_54837 TaxID=2665635 RepID=UPI00165972F9